MGKPNSLVTYLQGYVSAMFSDIKESYRRHSDWERDKTRLLHELEVRGERLLTLDLPALDKHFLKCLAESKYTFSGLVLSARCSKRVKVPAFLRDLYLQVFDDEGNLRHDPNHTVIFHLRSLFAGAKKLRLGYTERGLRDELSQFVEIEEGLHRPDLDWDGDCLFDVGNSKLLSFVDYVDRPSRNNDERCIDVLSEDDLSERQASNGNSAVGTLPACEAIQASTWACLDRVCDQIASSFGDLHSEAPNELPKHGPGVTAEGRLCTDKYDFRSWPAKLEAVFPRDYYGHPTLGVQNILEDSEYHTEEYSSRMIAVPKTRKGPRLIAAEPSSHQWIQQLVRAQLEIRLEKTPIAQAIRFRSQEQNQEFARRGSLDGSLATIDLKAASDRLSCRVVERAFKANLTLLERLHACRTRFLTYSDKHQSFNLKLLKFAPMGSAVTFPVQSIVYACVAIAIIIHDEKRKPTRSTIQQIAARVSVFGDDIVVPSQHCRRVCLALTELGLMVNQDKTFFTGRFRESCGKDWFEGTDVSPAYILEPSPHVKSSQVGSVVESSNNFHNKGMWNTSRYLQKTLGPWARNLPFILPDDGVLGLVSFAGRSASHLKQRWNASLHRSERRGVRLISRVRSTQTTGRSSFHQWIIEQGRVSQRDLSWSSGVRAPIAAYSQLGWISEFDLAAG